MKNRDAKHLADYVKEDLTRIRNDLNLLLKRIEEAEVKYKINKQKSRKLI